MTPTSFYAVALPDIPLIKQGDDLVELIAAAVQRIDTTLTDGDVLVISSKIVSKAEGRRVSLAEVQPSDAARQLAEETDKDPRVVELVLQESKNISRKAKGVLVVEHRLGFVSANAGIDQSNIEDGDHSVLLLPEDPDKTAHELRETIQRELGADVAIVISDTHGRPFRLGNVGVAIGIAGMQALSDWRGQPDLFGRTLAITQQGYADLVAAAAHLLCGEGAEGLPVILLRGLDFPRGDGRASDLNRPAERDLYR